MQLILEKHHLITAQQTGFLPDRQTVNDLWDKLTQICTCTDQYVDPANAKKREQYTLPALKGNLQSVPFTTILSSNILTIVYATENDKQTASKILGKITQLDSTVKPQLITDSSNFLDIETKIASSTALVVLLTGDALKQPHMEFSMLCAKRYFPVTSQVILVHDATSCFFPGYDEQPLSVREFFSEKAVTFLPCYVKEGVEEILQKYKQEMVALESSYNNKQSAASSLFTKIIQHSATPNANELELDDFRTALSKVCADLQPTTIDRIATQVDVNQDKIVDSDEFCKLIIQNEETLTKFLQYDTTEGQHENLWTRLFLSHKRSTGQGIAGRLYEGLKSDYKIFLDSEAKFKIHNLKEIVSQTEVFIFILTAGIFQSRWCREELESAMENKKKIIVVRELSFQISNPLPLEWQKSLGEILNKEEELIWMAEYNNACISALKKLIGKEDVVELAERKYLEENPTIFESSFTSLDMQKTNWLTDDFLYKMIQNKEIKEIKIGECNRLTDSTLIQLAKLPLESISFYGGVSFTNTGLAEFAKNCKTLRKLDLSVSQTCTDDTIAGIAQSGLPLETLIVQFTPITSDSLIQLAQNCVPLKNLDLSYTFYISDAGLISIAEHKLPLQNLNLTSNSTITDVGLIALAEHYIQLKSLCLENTTEITDEGIIALVKHKIPLETLSLASCKTFTDVAIIQLAQHCTTLRHLNLSNCVKISEKAIIQLAQLQLPLKHLLLNSCKIGDAGIIQLAQHKIPLEQLELRNSELTDDALIQLANHNIPLKLLDISSTKITDEGIIQFVRQSTNLEYLGIMSCNITDASLIQLGKQKLPLNSLNISATKITDSGLSHLVNLPLREIWLSNCENVSQVGKNLFKGKCNVH